MCDRCAVFPSVTGDENGRGYGANSRLMIRARRPDQPAPVLSALAPAGGYQSSWGRLLLVLGGMKRDAVPGMSINGRQASV